MLECDVSKGKVSVSKQNKKGKVRILGSPIVTHSNNPLKCSQSTNRKAKIIEVKYLQRFGSIAAKLI